MAEERQDHPAFALARALRRGDRADNIRQALEDWLSRRGHAPSTLIRILRSSRPLSRLSHLLGLRSEDRRVVARALQVLTPASTVVEGLLDGDQEYRGSAKSSSAT